jgi:hypothetical protein
MNEVLSCIFAPKRPYGLESRLAMEIEVQSFVLLARVAQDGIAGSGLRHEA